jgi:hypothetical protein
VILPLDSILESKYKSKIDKNQTLCKVMTLDEKTKIADKLRNGTSAVAAGLTSRRYFIFKRSFLLLF